MFSSRHAHCTYRVTLLLEVPVILTNSNRSIMEHRAEIRRRYGIKGSGTTDCLVSCFCCSCAVLQNEEELKLRHAREGIVVKEAYKSEQQMVMQPSVQAQGARLQERMHY